MPGFIDLTDDSELMIPSRLSVSLFQLV